MQMLSLNEETVQLAVANGVRWCGRVWRNEPWLYFKNGIEF